jgi:hypothetical protein
MDPPNQVLVLNFMPNFIPMLYIITKGHHMEGRVPRFNARSPDMRQGFKPRPDLHIAWNGVRAASIGIARRWCSPPWRCSYTDAHSTVRQPCRSPTSHTATRIVAALSLWLHAPSPILVVLRGQATSLAYGGLDT